MEELKQEAEQLADTILDELKSYPDEKVSEMARELVLERLQGEAN